MLVTVVTLLLQCFHSIFLLVEDFLLVELPLWIEYNVTDSLNEWSSEEWEIFFVLAGMTVLLMGMWICYFKYSVENRK